jgi:hypothetical protein
MSARRTLAIAALAAAGITAGVALARQRARHQREIARHAALIVSCCERLDSFEEAWAMMRGPGSPESRKLKLVARGR